MTDDWFFRYDYVGECPFTQDTCVKVLRGEMLYLQLTFRWLRKTHVQRENRRTKAEPSVGSGEGYTGAHCTLLPISWRLFK